MNLKAYDQLNRTAVQFLKYVVIGVISNCVGYLCYLLVTYLGGEPKITMTVFYSIGALIGFLANRKFTFEHDGHLGAAGIRYIAVQIVGYALNLTMLLVFYNWLGIAHQLVQAVAICVVAVFLFVAFRTFVFAPDRNSF